jgi:signal recognition particle receptor subunit beta
MQHHYYSIVVTGAFSSGKTTFIKTISHKTGFLPLQDVGNLFYGRIELDEETSLVLYETHTARQASELIEHPIVGYFLGGFVLVNTIRSETFHEALSTIQFITTYDIFPIMIVAQPHTPSIFSITWDIESFLRVHRIPLHVPMVECNAQERDSVKATLLSFLAYVAASAATETR